MQNNIEAHLGTAETIVLIKAAPAIGQKHGETVCCAGIDAYGNWHRMYPLSFRLLDDAKRFRRWDKVKYEWRRPSDDDRLESRHIHSQSLEISGRMKSSERVAFLDNQITTSLNAEFDAGRSLALLRLSIKSFVVKAKDKAELAKQQREIELYHSQSDMFADTPSIPREACPFEFQYKYSTDDGDRTGTCQDWETEATFFKWRNEYGEADGISRMKVQFGEVLPQRGLYFAMGTHSLGSGLIT